MPEQHVALKKQGGNQALLVREGTVLHLHNDWTTRLRKATITDSTSGAKMAVIEKIETGQTVNLEFSRKGAYSICYSSGPLKHQTRRCLKINVVPVTAT